MRAYRSFVATVTSLALVVQVPLSALAAGADIRPAANDDIARRCDALAAPQSDPQYSGPRVAPGDVDIGEALRVCAQAAEARPVRPRYQYLYGSVLLEAQRYAEAAQQFTAARQGGNAWGALALGVLSLNGSGVPKSDEMAASLFREAADAGVALADYNLGWLYEYGSGVPRDANEAARLYHRAVDGGVARGYAGLTQLSLDATPPRYTEAVRWAQQAADAGYSNGALAPVLGWGYLTRQRRAPRTRRWRPSGTSKPRARDRPNRCTSCRSWRATASACPRTHTTPPTGCSRRRSTGTRRRSSSSRGC